MTATDATMSPAQAVDAFRRATRKLAALAEEQSVVAARRREAIGTLRDSHGWSLQAIADAVGVSKGQVARLERGQ